MSLSNFTFKLSSTLSAPLGTKKYSNAFVVRGRGRGHMLEIVTLKLGS